MLNNIIEELKKENTNSIVLLTGKNTSTQHFYEKNGFYIVEHMIMMKKKF